MGERKMISAEYIRSIMPTKESRYIKKQMKIIEKEIIKRAKRGLTYYLCSTNDYPSLVFEQLQQEGFWVYISKISDIVEIRWDKK